MATIFPSGTNTSRLLTRVEFVIALLGPRRRPPPRRKAYRKDSDAALKPNATSMAAIYGFSASSSRTAMGRGKYASITFDIESNKFLLSALDPPVRLSRRERAI